VRNVFCCTLSIQLQYNCSVVWFTLYGNVNSQSDTYSKNVNPVHEAHSYDVTVRAWFAVSMCIILGENSQNMASLIYRCESMPWLFVGVPKGRIYGAMQLFKELQGVVWGEFSDVSRVWTLFAVKLPWQLPVQGCDKIYAVYL
jgi:hypothetical protein